MSRSNALRSLFATLFRTPRQPARRRRRTPAAAVQVLEDRTLLTNYLVTTDLDVVAADGFVSLREAIQAANANSAVNEAPAGEATGDAITFDASLAGKTIVLGGTELAITSGLTIDGEDRGITIDGDDLSRVFNINTADDVTLANLTLTRGNGAGADGGAVFVTGGGATALNDTVISDSSALHGGGIALIGVSQLSILRSSISGNNASAVGFLGAGGGLWNDGGTMTITDSELIGNSTSGAVGNAHGGALAISSGIVTISHTAATGNSADGAGGAIFQAVSTVGTLMLIESTIDNNTADQGGGLAIIAGTVVIDRSSVSGNTAENGGGLFLNGTPTVMIHGTTINGNSASGSGGGISVWNAVTLTIDSNSTISGNTVDHAGGGLWSIGIRADVTVSDTVIEANSAGRLAGGVYNGGGSMQILSSQVRDNSANNSIGASGGGGIVNVDGTMQIDTSNISDNSTLSSGGGVYNVRGTLAIQRTTIDGNGASRDGGGISNSGGTVSVNSDTTISRNVAGGDGGAIAIADGGSATLDSVAITDSTAERGGGIAVSGPSQLTIGAGSVSGNSASAFGGGLWNGGGTVSITDSTFASNTASQFGGGILILSGPVTVTNTAIVENTAGVYGGGIFQWPGGTDTLTLIDTAIDNNESRDQGGGLAISSGHVNIVRGMINGNTSGVGGGLQADGSTVVIHGTTITGNTATSYGGGIASLGNATITIEANSAISDNTAGNFGGGAAFVRAQVAIADSVIENNSAANSAGGIFNAVGNLQITSSLVRKNIANGTLSADGGGGVVNSQDGILDIVLSDITENSALNNGGGVFNHAGLVRLDAGSRIFNNNAGFAGGGIYTEAAGMLHLEDPGVVFSNTPDNFGGPPPNFSDASGWWIIDGEAAQVLQLDGTITFVNEFGDATSGYFTTSTQLVAEDWHNLVGNIVDNEIQWTNGTKWSRIPDLFSTGTFNGGGAVLVQQLGIELRLINEHGAASNGHFISSTEIVAEDWGGLKGTVVGDEIRWGNLSVWTAAHPPDGAEVNVSGAWAINGKDTAILQDGDTLLFVNERGEPAAGMIVDSTHVVATGWANLAGMIDVDNHRIVWDNGSVWDRVPVLDRNENWHTDDGLPTAVSQLGVRVLVTNEFGDRSEGRFDPLLGIVATDFGVVGQIDYDASAILWDIPFRWTDSRFGARDAAFADLNNWPWLV
jgi:hypothetical protein